MFSLILIFGFILLGLKIFMVFSCWNRTMATYLILISLLASLPVSFFPYHHNTVAWQLPTHPACAMFVSNHETRHDGIPPSSSSSSSSSSTGTSSSLCPCQPSTSVYLGKWYDVATVCANYHVEHHDFPEVRLGDEYNGRQYLHLWFLVFWYQYIWVIPSAFTSPS